MRPILLALLAAPLAFAQLDDNTLTVTASRSTFVQPDQVTLAINVTTTSDIALDDILPALGGTGASQSNLNYVYTYPAPMVQNPLTIQNPTTQWTFLIPVSWAKLTSTLAAIETAESASAKNPKLQVNYYIAGTQVSADLQSANPCAYPTLLSDAQRQAQKMADAAGAKLGGVLAVSSSPGAVGGATLGVIRALPPTVIQTGDFSAVSSLSSFLLTSPAPAPSSACSMTVQFKLLH